MKKTEPSGKGALYYAFLFTATPLLVSSALAVGIALTMVTWGFCFWKAYHWFLPQLGLPSISYLHSFGIALVFGLMKGGHIQTLKKEFDEESPKITAVRFAGFMAKPFVTLGACWIIKQYL